MDPRDELKLYGAIFCGICATVGQLFGFGLAHLCGYSGMAEWLTMGLCSGLGSGLGALYYYGS